MLGSLSVEPWPLAGPALDRLLTELKHVYGEPAFARFRLPDDPVLHWFGSRNRWDEIRFFERLLRTEAVRATLPELEVAPDAEIDLKLEWGHSAFTLDGELATALVYGGPYGAFLGSAREAKSVAEEACEELLEGRFDEVPVYRSYAAWSPWFYGIAWDYTWIGVDRRTSAVWLLCLSASD